MTVLTAEIGKPYIISNVQTEDAELNHFLLSLGCYAGEPITVISRKKSSCVVAIKDGRYSIDKGLALCISLAI